MAILPKEKGKRCKLTFVICDLSPINAQNSASYFTVLTFSSTLIFKCLHVIKTLHLPPDCIVFV